jgi:MFS family permease
MGWQGTAMTVGSGIGAPLAGWAADRSGATGGYVAAGVAGLGLAVLALGLTAVFGRGVRVGSEAPPRNTPVAVGADTLTD